MGIILVSVQLYYKAFLSNSRGCPLMRELTGQKIMSVTTVCFYFNNLPRSEVVKNVDALFGKVSTVF